MRRTHRPGIEQGEGGPAGCALVSSLSRRRRNLGEMHGHAMAHRAGIAAHGLWSISRGLARGLESRGEYKRMMDHADMPRQDDLDGCGNLSQYALSDFVSWFLRVCLDQVTFMSGLFEIDTLAPAYGAMLSITIA